MDFGVRRPTAALSRALAKNIRPPTMHIVEEEDEVK